MRTTVTIEKDMVDELLKKTKASSKASAVREAIQEYLRREKIEKIRSMKGKLDFDEDAGKTRHNER